MKQPGKARWELRRLAISGMILTLGALLSAPAFNVPALAGVPLPARVRPQCDNDRLDFTLANRTGVTIQNIYMSPSTEDNWGVDRLGDAATIADGQDWNANFFTANDHEDKWDIKLTMVGGRDIIFKNVDLSQINTLTIHYDGPTAYATTDGGQRYDTDAGTQLTGQDFALRNRSDRTIQYVYVAQGNATSTVDLLGDDVIAPNAQYTVHPHVENGDVYSIRIVMDNGLTHVFRNLNLSTISTVTFLYRNNVAYVTTDTGVERQEQARTTPPVPGVPGPSHRLAFTLQNRSGQTAVNMFVSRHSSSQWNGNVLGRVVADGDNYPIAPADTGENSYDVKFIMQGGRNHTFMNLNLARISTITLFYRGGMAYLSTDTGDLLRENE